MKQALYPQRNDFYKLSRSYNLIPVYREIWADTETPIGVFKKVGVSPFAFLLESVEGGERWGRYSFIGVNPSVIFKSIGNKVIVYTEEGLQEKTVQNPIDFLEDLITYYSPAPIEGLPRFFGGAVGYLGYDMVRFIERLPNSLPDELNLPDSWFIIPKEVLVFDNLTQSIKVISNIHICNDDDVDLKYNEALYRIDRIIDDIKKPVSLNDLKSFDIPHVNFKSNIPRPQFESMVAQAKQHIQNGEIIQVVLSQRFWANISVDPFNVYRALRCINPSPYLFYLKFKDMVLLGSSPEVMVRVEGNKAILRPIAGTRPRGKTESEDISLEKELLADEKERAEHIMLVDLGRNDLGRVTRYGTVHVTESMVVERYSHVMHLVSNIEGVLADGITCFDVLRATFPAGTVTGAPKVRAMEIIDELEPHKRGPYAGGVGYFSFSGNMDLAITIRSMLILKDRISIQVGAGIVADSIPEREYQETVHKAEALFAAVVMASKGLE